MEQKERDHESDHADDEPGGEDADGAVSLVEFALAFALSSDVALEFTHSRDSVLKAR